jgi:hypothetical protein
MSDLQKYKYSLYFLKENIQFYIKNGIFISQCQNTEKGAYHVNLLFR